MIKLIFAGKVKDGTTEEQVIAGLARLLKQQPALVREKLFAGRRVVIKRTDSETLAEQWRQAFAKVGAELEVVREGSDDSSLPPSKDPSPAAQLHSTAAPSPQVHTSSPPAQQRRKRYASVVVAFVVVFAVLLGALAWWLRPLWHQPELEESQWTVVSALAAEGVYALGHLDVERALSMYRIIAGGEPELQRLPGVAGAAVQRLAQAGFDVSEQVDHAWVAAFRSGDLTDEVIVLTGQFANLDPEAILPHQSHIEKTSDGVFLVAWLDEKTCEQLPVKALVVEAGHILVGDPERVRTLRGRLSSKAAADIDLADWRRISSAQPVSLAIFVPANLDAALTGAPRMAARPVAKTLAPSEGLYLGAEPTVYPVGVELIGHVASSDQDFLRKLHEQLQNRLAGAKAEAAQNWPELVALYDRFSVSGQPGYLRTAVRFDENVQQDISRWIASLFTVAMGGEASAPVEERLELHPLVFQNLNSPKIAPYNPVQHNTGFGFLAQTQTGPFGVGVRKVELLDDGRFELTVGIEAEGLPNVAHSSGNLRLRITNIYNSEGYSLLQENSCGRRDELQQQASLRTFRGPDFRGGEQTVITRTSGSVTVTLPIDVAPTDVARMEGVVEYDLPLAVDQRLVSVPLAGKVIEHNDERMRFLAGDEQAVNYRYSGDAGDVLAVHARNAQGKVLAHSSGMSGESLFGTGYASSNSYSGTVTSVEVVFAAESEPLRFPFELSTMQPAVAAHGAWGAEPKSLYLPQEGVLPKSEPPVVNASVVAQEAKTTAGPATVVLQRAQFDQRQGLAMKLGVYIANDAPMPQGLGAGVLRVTSITDQAGQETAVGYSAPIAFTTDGGYWSNGEFQPDEQRPWYVGEVQVRDRAARSGEPSRMEGLLTLHAAESHRAVKLPLEVGARWQGDGVSVVLQRWEGNRLTFSVDGDVAKVLAITAFDGTRNLASQPAARRWMFGEPRVEMELTAQPAALTLFIATSLQRQSFPFEVELGRASPSD